MELPHIYVKPTKVMNGSLHIWNNYLPNEFFVNNIERPFLKDPVYLVGFPSLYKGVVEF